MAYRMGVDTGGTFTDLVAVDTDGRGLLHIAKVPSTPAQPGRAVFDALARSGVPAEELSLLVLGTTLGINAVLERRGARVLYLTTDGFQDMPFIQRIDKKDPYDLQWQKPVPFVARRDCIGVRERVGAGGEVLAELTGDELERVAGLVAERLAEHGGAPARSAALAVNLLFSYANPAHERRLAEFLGRRFPDLPVSTACAIAPMWREYERGSTAILDAYLRPRMSGWIEELEQGLGERRFGGALTIMKSNGGQVAAAAARELPAHTMLSGLAGGVIGGRYFGEQAGRRDLITFDMGGTSTDVALVLGGQISYTTGYEVEFSLPVTAPSVDLRTVGAGGGSIAWIDAGGMLRVGPQSAGATPGPVCYGHGGEQVTVTDANLVLGRIDPGSFLGGEMRLDAAAARHAMEELGGALDMSTEETATAIVDLVNEQMADAIRVLTVERGIDPRRFALVAFGGAGPLHGAAVAAALGMREMIVPPHPGLTSAFGALAADVRVDRRATRFHRSDLAEAAEIDATLKRLQREAVAEAHEQGCAGEPVVQRSISMRYAGQNYEQDVPVPSGPVADDALKALLDDFGEAHRRFYGHHFPGEVVEIIHFTVTALGATATPVLPEMAPGSPPAPRERHAVRIGASAHPACPVYRRDAVPAACTLTGPLIVEELDSTTLVPAGHALSVLPNGIFRVALPEGEAAASTAGAAGAAEAAAQGAALDPVTLTIIDNRLANITREMGTAMMRAAYSPIFSESKDFSCAVFDAEAELVGQGEFCPAQLGAMTHTVRWTVREIGAGNFAPGDVVIHNDPYRAGCHLPEHLLLKPVFDGEEIRLFVAVIGHVAEIGAMVVGSFASNATEVFQEGLRLPPVKLMSRGEHNRDIWRIVMANHRTPRATWGDFHAMLGALNVGERRCHELFDPLRRRRRAGRDPATHRLLRAPDARRDRRHPRRRVRGRGGPGGRRHHRRPVRHPRHRRGARRRRPGRLHPLRPAGARPDQRHLRRHRLGHLQRRAAGHRHPHPAQRRLLPADHDHRATRLDRERALPGAVGGRQHRDPAPHRRRDPARPGRGRPGTDHGLRGRHLLQLPVRRGAPGHRRVLRPLPLRGERLGRPVGHRRQQRPEPHPRQLPQHSGGDLRDAVPVPGALLRPEPRLRRRRAQARRPRHPSRPVGDRWRRHGEHDDGPREERRPGAVRRHHRRLERRVGAASRRAQAPDLS